MAGTTETQRIADQVRRAVRGPAWHGPSMLEVLSGLTARDALRRPVAGAHSIWELVVHTIAWIDIVARRLDGTAPLVIADELNWPPVDGRSRLKWRETVERLERAAAALEAQARGLDDDRLEADLPGVDDTWTAYQSLHGVVQHVLYHAGQIAILRKGLRP